MGRKLSRDIALIIDFEATCWNHTPPEGMESEIIEIGISGIDYVTKEVLLKDTIIVKPEKSTVSKFCTELTTLTQEYVDEHGISLAEACEILVKKYKSRNRIWFSWGEYDRKMIEKECANKGIPYPFGRTHINIKPLFSFMLGIKTDLGVGQALEHMRMEFEGTPHRGGDDAYNIGKIMKRAFMPLMGAESYGERTKKEHEKLDEHLRAKYTEEQLSGNAARVINKTTPQDPDKTNR